MLNSDMGPVMALFFCAPTQWESRSLFPRECWKELDRTFSAARGKKPDANRGRESCLQHHPSSPGTFSSPFRRPFFGQNVCHASGKRKKKIGRKPFEMKFRLGSHLFLFLFISILFYVHTREEEKQENPEAGVCFLILLPTLNHGVKIRIIIHF